MLEDIIEQALSDFSLDCLAWYGNNHYGHNYISRQAFYKILLDNGIPAIFAAMRYKSQLDEIENLFRKNHNLPPIGNEE
ncbi:MAG: hypothetical protein P4L50_03370 [Anaerolineaceae bacterium]|nr:hypothetical protein [Anaerolineaceae bacterium]